MKKHVQSLLLLAALLLPWATQAQGVSGCAFTTGVDNTKWVTLSSAATEITAIYGDDYPSSCINIGFPFYFGGNIYTQFSCNSNGRFRLGPTAVSNYWTNPFTTLTSADNNDLPFVTAYGADNTLTVTGNYVKYELVGTAPNRILVVEYYTSSEYNDGDGGDLVNYQIQLLEDSNRVRLVYGTTAATTYDDYQIGIAGTATDFLMVDATNHATLTTPTTFANSSWPGVGRYYEFTMGMPPSCPGITSITTGDISVGSAFLSWTHGAGTPASYEIEYYVQGDMTTLLTTTSTTPNILLTGLDSNTTYVFRVRANCGTDGYGLWDSTTFTTNAFGCAVPDLTSFDTVLFSNGTSTNSGTLVYSSWGNTMYQAIYTAAELQAAGISAGPISGVDFGFASNSMAKEFTIFMGNTGRSAFSSSTDYVDPGTLQQVYGPTAYPTQSTGGWRHFDFTTAFQWDGSSNIIVCTFMNQPSGTSHTSSGFTGYYTTGPSYTSLYRYKDSNPFTLANYTTSSGGSYHSYRASVHFYTYGCAQLATCAAPMVQVDSMTSDEAYLSWIPGYDETSWDVEYRVKGTSTWMSAWSGVTSTTFTLSNLTPATYYEFRVLTICSPDTFASATVEGLTECVPVANTALPYTYGFEDLTSTGSGTPLNVCWDRGYLSGSTFNGNSYPYASTTNHTGTRSIYFYAYSTTTKSWACLPEFEDSVNTLRLQFWARKSSTSYSGQINVGVMTDPHDFSTYQNVATLSTDATTNWQHFETGLSSAPGTGYITIMVDAGSTSSNYIYVDDITVDEMPFCTTPVVDSVLMTTTSADIYLSDITNASDIVVTLTAGTWDTTVVEYASPVAINDLTPGVTYSYSIKTHCTNGDSSDVRTGTFTTICAPIEHDDLPFTYGFENITTTGSGIPLAPCWDRGYLNGSTFYSNNYPYASSSYYHSGNRSLYFYASGTTVKSWLCLPEFEDSLYTLRLKFWAMKSSTSYSGQINVGVMTDPHNFSTYQNLRTLTTNNTTSWQQFEVSLSQAPATGYITIMVDAGSTSTNYMYVDDITVEELPFCTTPVVDSVLLTTNSAELYISDVDNASDIVVTLTAGTWDTIVTDYGAPISIYDLAPGTTYNYSIITHCTNSDVSGACTGSFSTECVPIAHDDLPLNYGFEDLTSTGSGIPLAPCWDRGYLSSGTFNANNYPYASTTNHTGTRSLYFYGNGTSTRSWLCLPEFEDSLYTLQLNFWGYKTSTSYNGRIIVGVMTDPHTSSTFQPLDTVTISSVNTWTHFEVPLDNAPGAGYITIMDLPGSSSNYFYVDDIHVDEIPTCLTPTGLTASNIAMSSADLAWNTRTGSETSWLIGVNGYETEVYDSTATVTGLRPSMANTVTVRAVCGAGDTSEMAYITITTLCGLVPPFHEDFESYTTYSSASSSTPFIPCWTRLNNGTSYGGVPYVGSSTYNHTLGGAKGLYWYGSTTSGTYGDYYYIVLPMLDTANYQINTLRVKFWAKASSTSYHPIVRVGVMTDPTNVNTFQAVNSNIAINPGSSTAWTEFSVDLSSYTGNGAYIAIGALRPTSTWYMYMDDISVIQIPDCDGVSNIALTGVTTSTATLNWTENGTATSWEVEYGPAGFPRGAGTTATVTGVPYTITGLNANTQYDIYVAPTCTGVPEEVQYTFRTECTPLVSLPYSMGFETSDGVNSVGSSTTTTWVDCWHRLNNGTMYFGYPYVASNTTYAHSGSRGLYWYNSTTTGTYGDYQIVVLPCFDTTNYSFNNLMLSFWAKTAGTTATLQVGVMTNPLDPATFQQVSTVTVGNAAWERKDVSFEYFTGNGGYVAIRAQRASWTIYVDDITLGFLPDCPRVTNMHASNITTSQADLTWTENGSATAWNIIYGPTGFNPHSSTANHETAYSLPHTLYGLNTNTVYDVYVAPDCNGTTDTNMFSFRTECEAMTTLPYTMGFETSDGVSTTGGSTSDVFVNCWHRLNNGSMYFGYPYVSSSSTYNHTTGGTKGLYWMGSTTTGTYGDYQVVVLPAVDTDIYAINTLQFKFWAKSSSTSYYPSFQVGVMTDPYDNSTFQLVANVNVGNNTNWEEYTTVLGNFTGYGQYVALRALRPASTWYAYVDDITLELAPLCPAITEVSVGEVGTTAAHVSWTIQSGIQGVPTSYEVTVTPDQAGSTPMSFIAYQPSLLITGLTANTDYDVEVRADCDYDGYGPWSDEASFTTADYPCAQVDPNNSIDVTIGTGTTTSSYVPSYSTYNYGLSQQIYTAAEINGSGSITSISLMPSAISQQRTYEIYMAHTTQSTLSGFIHPTGMVCVYNGGPVTLTANQWVTWNLTTPFSYNGTDNLLICFRDMTGAWVSGNAWYGHSGNSVYVYQDGGAYDPYTYTGGTVATFRNNIKIYGMTCLAVGTCAPPLVVVDSVSEDEITVSWAPGGDETSWDVDYRVGNSGNWTYEGNESSTTYTFSNLTSNTEYQIRITANCSDTDMASIITVRTPCAAVSIPYTQTFEGVPSGTSAAFPSCMHRINNGTSYGYYPYVGSSTSYNHTPGGSQGLYYYSTTTTGTYGDYFVVVMPRVDVSENPINTLQLLFWGKPSSTSYVPSFEVGVLTDPEDISTYQQVSTVNFDHSTTDWQPYEIPLSSYTGTGEYIALRANRTSSSWYVYIDDISIEHAPACPRVGNITFRHITGNSATVAWTPTSADEYEVEYGPVGFTPGTGTRLQYIIDDSVALTGLYPSTSYHVYVRGICMDDTSNWSFVSQFGTSCATLTLPFDENFDNLTTSTTNATGVTPLCWNYLMTNSSYSSSTYVPQLYYYSTDPGSYAHSGHYSLRLYGESYTTLPALSDEDTSVTIGFWTKHSSTDYRLAVGVMSNPSNSATFVPVDTINYVGTSTPEYHEIDLSGHLGTAHYIAFRNWYTNNSYGYSYHYIDDISVWRNSTCPTPSYVRVDNVSNHNATVYWGDTSNGAYNNVRVFWGVINNIGAAIDSADVYSGNSYTLTGLTGNTTYYVWLYGQCMDDDSRALSTTFTTTVDCVPVDNVTVTTDYHAFNLSWDVPVGGEPVTGYVVEYKPASASAWISDTTTNTHYYVSGLTANTLYDYRVGTECDPYSSTFVQGTAQTQGCGLIITAGGDAHSYLPTNQYYNYSYTQQIYLDNELTGLDTITDIAFHLDPSYTCTGRNIVIYMGNTTRSSFTSTADYIAPANLQQVYSGTLTGNGWISFHLTTPFERTAGSNLVVAVDDNTGSYTSSIYWTATATSTSRAIYFYQDGSDILPSAPSASSSGPVSYVNQIKLTNATCFIPDCNTPLPTMDTVMERQAVVVWNTETGHTYTVEYRVASDTTWTVADAANTTGISTISALSPGMNYVARVSTDCNGTLLTGSVNFTTLCAPVDLPYTEDFEGMSGTYARSCWTIGTTNLGTSNPYPTVVSLTGDPNKLCLFYNGAYAIMPRMNAPLNQLQVRFSFLQGGDGVRFLIGLMDDPAAPINTMTVLDTIVRSDIDTTTNTINYTYSFAQLSDADSAKYIAFWDAFNDNYSFIDNLVVEYIPNCQPVTGLTASSVTTSGATVSWQDNNTGASGYYVEYGLHGFTPGTGTGFMETTTMTTLTGLAHSTSYDLYVYTVCGADTAIASQVLNFSTECDAFTTLPYTNNFEGYVPAGNTATNILPNCWMTENAAAYLYYNTNGLQAPSQSHALYLLGNGIVVLPEMGMSLSQLMVTFHDYKASGYGIIVGAVDVTATGSLANNFEPIDTVIFPGVTNVMDVTSVLSDYTGTASHIALKAFGTTGTGVSHYIDDVTIDYIPNCLAPQRVSTSFLSGYQADLVWRTSQAPSYSLEYGLHGFTPGTGTSMTTTTRSASLTNLTPQTQYDVYLVSLCSASETSDTTLYTFTTACDFVTLPYTQTFETATTGSSSTTSPFGADCMIRLNNGTSYGGYPYISSSSTYNHTSGGSKGLYWYNTTTTGTYGDYQCVVLPPVDPAMGIDTLQFKFWAKASSTSYNPIFQVGVMTDPYDITSFVGVDTISIAGCTTWTEYVVPLATYTGNGMYVALKADRPSSSWYAYVDDLGLEIAPTCIAPQNIYSTAASTTTLTVDWTPITPAVNWQVEYGPLGYTFGSTAGTRFATAVHPVTLTGLDTLTSYDVYVRPICSATDTGAWSAAATLMTSMCDNSHIVTTATAGSAQGTSYYAPVNNFYRYTLSETIIDSAELGGPMDIEYLAYYYDYSAAVTDKTNCTVYFQPTTKTVFSSSTDVVAVNSTAVKVYTGNFNFTQGWNFIPLDTTYHYNGLGNLMVIVDDNSNDYNTSSYVYRTRTCNGYKTLTYYSDTYDPDAHSATNLASYSGTKTYYQYRPEMQLISCGYVPSCQAPVITSTTGDYQSATMTWNGTGTAYEVAIKAVSATSWPAATAVNGNSYTFTGLQPTTPYQLRVRQDCTADTLGYSDWATTTFTTDSLPCISPMNLAVNNQTNATATFSWTARGTETAWDIHVWTTSDDSIYTVTTNPVTLGGFTAGVTYNAAIRALCGTAQNIEGMWSDTITFTTATCPVVTGLATNNVTFNSVTLNWNAATGAQSYRVSYESGQLRDSNIATSNTFTFSGLQSERQYTFYVRTVCGEGWMSETAAQVTATTADEPSTTYTVTATSNNTAYGYVSGGGNYGENQTATLTAIANTGYHFTQWNDGITTNPRSVTVTSDTSFMATFVVNQYTVTVNNNHPTMGSVSGTGTYDHGTTATLTATANPGHHFTGWNDGDTTSTRNITVTSDTVFTANFAVNQYTVTVAANDASMGSVTGGGEYDYGSTAVLTATPNAGYFFNSWSDGNTSNPRSLVVTGDIDLIANFSDDSTAVTEYTVTLTVNDASMGSLSTYGGTYAEGSTFTVTATANAGYHFVNWSDNNTENPRTITVNNNITLQANFAANVDSTAVLTIVVNGNGFVTINGQDVSTYRGRLGDVVSLSATAFEGSYFSNWSDGNNANPRNYTLTQNNETLTANFNGVGIEGVATMSCVLYPNPAKGATTVSVTGVSGKVRIAVLDLSGREVLSETLECAADCEKSLDIEGLAEGAYFVRITSEQNAPMVKKLIVR